MRNLRSYYSATIAEFLQQSDSEIESHIIKLFSSCEDIDEITEYLSAHEDLYSGDIFDFAFREAIRQGATEYIVENAENFDLNDARFAQTVAVRPNAMYRLSGWIKAADIFDSGRGANLSVEGVYVFSESVYDTAGEWVYIETYGLTGDEQTDVTIYARVGGYSGESHGGTAAFDDLSLVEVEALPENVYADTWYTLPSVPVVDEPAADDPTEASPFWPWLIATSAVYAFVTL